MSDFSLLLWLLVAGLVLGLVRSFTRRSRPPLALRGGGHQTIELYPSPPSARQREALEVATRALR